MPRRGSSADGPPGRLGAEVADWLVDAVSPGMRAPAWQAGHAPPRGLLAAAVLHGVEGWVHRRARSSGVEVDGLDAAVHAALGRHQRGVADAALALGTLTRAGVDALVVKGPALVAGVYDDPALRSSVDLDLLVRPAQVEAGVRALERAGFHLLDRNWPVLLAADVHELTMSTPTGGILDLHWSLGPTPLRLDPSPAAAVLMARAVEVESAGLTMRTLAPTDTVVHLAVHAAASGGHRLIWLADLRAAFQTHAPDPGNLATVAGEWGGRPAVDLMLRRLRGTLGYLPSGVWETWGSFGPWNRLGTGLERLSPPERTGTDGSPARLVARSCRGTQARSLAAFGLKSAAWAAHRGRSGPVAAELHDADDARSARYPSTDPGARRLFFSRLADRPE